FDFDGTLVDKKGHIHPADVDILRREDRVVFVPATGRPLHAVRRAFKKNHLFVDRPIEFPLLLQNGAMLYLPREKLHQQSSFSTRAQAILTQAALDHPRVSVLFFGPDRVYASRMNDLVRKKAAQFQLNVRLFNPAVHNVTFTKLNCLAESLAELEAFIADLTSLSLEIHFSQATTLEVNRAG
ncbi:MAG: HAD family phosphatase, partial [bacterium]|nr:HAD family phosphatase [bacterium]